MGDHFMLDLYECDPDALDDENFLKQLLVEAAKIAGATVLKTDSWKFDPCGVTAFTLLSESHISIHTWPEKCMAVCDVFTCGDHTLPDSAVRYMYDMMQATSMVSSQFIRPLDEDPQGHPE